MVELNINMYEISGRPSVSLIESEMKRAIDRGENICCVVLPNNMKQQYKQFKQAAIKECEMITQVVTDASFRKKNFQSIATKVLLQIIAKRGNTLWVPRTMTQVESAMLIGFETCKAAGQTVMSICATINSTFSSIFSSYKTYPENKDKYSTMATLHIKAYEAYQARNDCLPE